MFRPFSRRLLEGVTDAPTAPEPQPQTPQNEPEPARGRHPDEHLKAEINRLKAVVEKQEAAEASRKSKAEKAAAAAAQKKLEDEGNYKDALKSKDDAIAKMEADFAKKERDWALRAGLAGMNDLALKGAIADCPADADVNEYIAAIKANKENAHLFAGEQPQRETPGGKPSFKGDSSMSLEQRLKYRDPENPVKAAEIRAQARSEKAASGGYG